MARAQFPEISATDAWQTLKDHYDSAKRREVFAVDLERRGIDQQTILARMTAEASQGKHRAKAVEISDEEHPRPGRAAAPIRDKTDPASKPL